MARSQDVEIDLGTGRLLGLFFGLVVICALFFVLGYSLGRNSSSAPAVEASAPPANAPRPKAGPAPPTQPAAPAGADELTFYKRVGQKEPNAQLAPESPAAEQAPAKAAPEMPRSSGTYTVQVAAVTKQEDAQALVGALKKKSYPVFVNSSPGDKLFHVQVGPFADLNQAEDMRARLAGDGYSPIVKK
jgi:DedD protein